MANIAEVVGAWQPYCDQLEGWQQLVSGIEPKDTACGPVYEMPNPINRPNESFAIADMRQLDVAEPHHHINGETEIYFVLQGLGLAVVGGKEQKIEPGSIIVTPPNTSHFTIPKKDLIIAVVNTPRFRAANVVVDKSTSPEVGFDLEQFNRLTSK